jgi:hypothetical protein
MLLRELPGQETAASLPIVVVIHCLDKLFQFAVIILVAKHVQLDANAVLFEFLGHANQAVFVLLDRTADKRDNLLPLVFVLSMLENKLAVV